MDSSLDSMEGLVKGLSSYGLTVHGTRRTKIMKLVDSFNRNIEQLKRDRVTELGSADVTFKAVSELRESMMTQFTRLETKLDCSIPEYRSNNQPTRLPQPVVQDYVTGDLGVFCPGFYGEYSYTRKKWDSKTQSDVYWKTVQSYVPFTSDVRAWVTASPIWSLNGGYRIAGGGMVIRATCAVGGNTARYVYQVTNGIKHAKRPLSHGSSTRLCCDCELRITYMPGSHISLIEVKLDADEVKSRGTARSHIHGQLNEVEGGGICARLIQLDPTLFVHNKFTEVAKSRSVPPASVLTHVIKQLIDERRDNSALIINELNSAAFKKLARSFCARLRGSLPAMKIEDLTNLSRAKTREYRRLCLTNRVKARHFPRIIGLSHNIGPDGSLSHLCLTISTTAMLETAYACQSNQALLTDCTFKRVQSGYPLLCIGVKPFGQPFRLISISIILTENTRSYKSAFKHLKSTIEEQHAHGDSFSPSFIMGDTAAAITAASRAVFPTARRIVCYAHVMHAMKLYLRYKCNVNHDLDWYSFRAKVQILAGAKSTEEFARLVDCLANHQTVSDNPALLAYVRKPGGYFDVCDWRSKWYAGCYGSSEFGTATMDCPRTNNATEANNRKIKSLIFRNEILSFGNSLDALLGDSMVRFSTEADLPVERGPVYSELLPVWRRAMRIRQLTIQRVAGNRHFMNNEAAEGDMYAIGADESTIRAQLSPDFNPFATDIARIAPLVYLPPASWGTDSINLSPLLGGPACSCDGFCGTAVCEHICLVYMSERGLNPPTVLTNVGEPNAFYGRYRPRRPTSALERMEPRRVEVHMSDDSP